MLYVPLLISYKLCPRLLQSVWHTDSVGDAYNLQTGYPPNLIRTPKLPGIFKARVVLDADYIAQYQLFTTYIGTVNIVPHRYLILEQGFISFILQRSWQPF